MIELLREFYEAGEIVAPYEKDQEELYAKARKEFAEESKKRGLKHHTDEFKELRDTIGEKYKIKGLKVDFIACNNPEWQNFSPAAAKRFLIDKGFDVLVTEEDFSLLLDPQRKHDTKGYKIICDIFGEIKVKELMAKAVENGGEPDLFVYLTKDPNNAWFVEVKKRGERLTPAQEKHFPLIRNILCPVEILRLVPSSAFKSSSSTEEIKNMTRNSVDRCINIRTDVSRKPLKPIWYSVNGEMGAEAPKLFKLCIKSLRTGSNLSDILLENNIDAESKIVKFRNRPVYGELTKLYMVTADEWEVIFDAVRNAKRESIKFIKNKRTS